MRDSIDDDIASITIKNEGKEVSKGRRAEKILIGSSKSIKKDVENKSPSHKGCLKK